MTDLCKELLHVSLGISEQLSHTYVGKEWERCYEFADKQAIIGVLWAGIKALPKEQMPYLDLLMDWYGQFDYLNNRSIELNKVCNKIYHGFKKAGFESVILKGQSNAKLYDGNLLRTPGDIDIWLFAEREKICNFLRENVQGYNSKNEGDLHTEFNWKDILVEVHFTAMHLITPKYEKRLVEWLRDEKEKMRVVSAECKEDKEFPSPSLEFNLVYLMLHMYHHYLFEGIGMRHVIDYYLVLRTLLTSKGLSEFQRITAEAYKILKWLGADDFTAAMMYVIATILNPLEPSKTEENKNDMETLLMCKPDSWRGKMLMSAIIDGGNFGKANKKNSDEYRKRGWKRVWRFISRNSQLIAAYPSEIGWHVLKRIWGCTQSRRAIGEM